MVYVSGSRSGRRSRATPLVLRGTVVVMPSITRSTVPVGTGALGSPAGLLALTRRTPAPAGAGLWELERSRVGVLVGSETTTLLVVSATSPSASVARRRAV